MMEEYPKEWSDQPDCVLKAHPVVSFSTNKAIIEIRDAGRSLVGGEQSYYVSVGNLFGSQTLSCPNIYHVWAVIKLTQQSRKGPVVPPPGVTVLT